MMLLILLWIAFMVYAIAVLSVFLFLCIVAALGTMANFILDHWQPKEDA